MQHIVRFAVIVTENGMDTAPNFTANVSPAQLNAKNPTLLIRSQDNLRLWAWGLYFYETFQHIERFAASAADNGMDTAPNFTANVTPAQLNATNPTLLIRTQDNLRLWAWGVYVYESLHVIH